jgi:hypothetical protein
MEFLSDGLLVMVVVAGAGGLAIDAFHIPEDVEDDGKEALVVEATDSSNRTNG